MSDSSHAAGRGDDFATKAPSLRDVGAPPAGGWLLLALALAVALRLVSWSQSTLMMNDGPDFLWQAEKILVGDWDAALSHPYLPLYASLTAGVARCVDDFVVAGLLVSITGGLLLVLASWGLGRRVPGARLVAPCSAVAAAINVRAVNYTADIQSDGLFAGLVLCALWAMWTSRERAGARLWAALAGVLTGLAYLTRYEGLYLCLPWAGLVATSVVTGRARTAMLGASLGFGVALALVAFPYVAKVHDLTGQWAVSIKPSALRMGLTDADEFLLAPAESPLGWPFIPRMQRPEGSVDAIDAGRAGDAGAAPNGARTSAGAAAGAGDDGASHDADPRVAPSTQNPASARDPEATRAPQAADEQDAAHAPKIDADEPPTPEVDDTRPAPADGESARAPDVRSAPRTAGLASTPSPSPAFVSAGFTSPVFAPASPALPLAARGVGTRSVVGLVAEVVRGFVHTLRGEAFVLALAGGCVLWRKRRALLLFLLGASAGWLAVLAVHLHVNGYLSNRHFITAIVPMLPLCGAGIAWFGEAVTWRRVVLALALFESVRASTWPQRDDKRPRLEALAWVREHTEPDQWFLTQRRRDGYYASRRAIVTNMPCRDDSTLKVLRQYDVAYAVFSLDSLEDHQPGWIDGERFEEVTRFEDTDETVLVLRPTFVEMQGAAAGR